MGRSFEALWFLTKVLLDWALWFDLPNKLIHLDVTINMEWAYTLCKKSCFLTLFSKSKPDDQFRREEKGVRPSYFYVELVFAIRILIKNSCDLWFKLFIIFVEFEKSVLLNQQGKPLEDNLSLGYPDDPATCLKVQYSTMGWKLHLRRLTVERFQLDTVAVRHINWFCI